MHHDRIKDVAMTAPTYAQGAKQPTVFDVSLELADPIQT
jgi:hypothetical protein